MAEYSAFSYKPGKSFVHKMSAWKKILFIPFFNIVVFSLDMRFAFACIILQGILFAFLHFTFKEQVIDLTPVIWYGVFMYMVGFVSESYMLIEKNGMSDIISSIYNGGKIAFSDKRTLGFVLKFLACCQSASLMFKTCTSLQLKEGIELIEVSIRRYLPLKKEAKFAIVVSMFINFIPAVFKIWGQLKKAWVARGGKNGLKMYLTLIPVLFSVGLKYSFNCARSIMARSN